MNKFKDGKVYMIVDDLDITMEMINYSTSKSKDEMPIKTVDSVDKRIIETSEPVASVFVSYNWYDIDEIEAAWEAL